MTTLKKRTRKFVITAWKKIGLLMGLALLVACTQEPALVVNKGVGLSRSGGVVGASQMVVREGDNLYRIARIRDVGIRDLIEANHLNPPYKVRTGQVLNIPDAKYYVVKPGDTAFSISRDYGVDMGRLVRINDIPEPYVVRSGTRLRLPSATSKDLLPGGAESQVASVSESRSREVSRDSSVVENNVSLLDAVSEKPAFVLPKRGAAEDEPIVEAVVDNAPLETSPFATDEPQALQETAAADVAGDVDPTAPTPTLRAEEKYPAPVLRPGTKLADVESAAAEEIAAKSVAANMTFEQVAYNTALPEEKEELPTAEVAEAASGGFVWPTKGRVISRFGAKRGGLYNDGINIAASEGAAIHAADSGEVVYSGNELRGYGNLVLIKHSNGFVTAYAHTKDIVVKKGDTVTKGQTIASVGTTGHVTQPQLHFSIRKGRKAVDPQQFLPKG